jgi:hypothetical protein
MLLELIFFKIFTTPGDIGSFSFLLEFPNSMMAVTHNLEVFSIFGDELFGLLDRSLLMSLHS